MKYKIMQNSTEKRNRIMKRKVDVDRLLYVFNAVIQNLEDELRNIPKDDFDNIIKRALYKNSIDTFYESIKVIERIYEVKCVL